MLQLIVLGHEARTLQREGLNHRCELQNLHETLRVLLQFLGLQLLVDVDVLNAVFEGLDNGQALFVLSLLVGLQVVDELLRGQMLEWCRENVGLIPEELVNQILVLDVVVNISCQVHN